MVYRLQSCIQIAASIHMMDLSYVTYCAPVPRPLFLLLHAVDVVGYCISAVLYYLGLHPSFQTIPSPWDDRSVILEAAQYSPPQSPPAAPAAVKGRLRVVEYGRFSTKAGGLCCRDPPTCAVCLTGIGVDDEVRELGNCCHAFHRECIDQWIDVGKVTCPLCRLELLPAKGKGGVKQLVSLVGRLW